MKTDAKNVLGLYLNSLINMYLGNARAFFQKVFKNQL